MNHKLTESRAPSQYTHRGIWHFLQFLSAILVALKSYIMSLVDYSDSDNSDDDQSHIIEAEAEAGSKCAPHSQKRKQIDVSNPSLPPLPDSFHDLYPTAKRRSNQDDPGLHSGRQRSTPHVEGNWPTHIYIECELNFFFFEGYLNSHG